ncbi:Rubisco activation protein CbbO [Enterovibrio norvegicus FF-33]|uniref:nitric oxide reductase activation protein NorD n=1 Tax=Enterovibrio norvegicus TaxID=188144 RepID=UPI000302E19F|nr:VWA domain-containing protein [Enterovibrio norvegicus]OEE65772.1 Rubisco activation protein CbbO [Enterovibrio norvegicus FF-33]
MTNEPVLSIQQTKAMLQSHGALNTLVNEALDNAQRLFSPDELRQYLSEIEQFIANKQSNIFIQAWVYSIPNVYQYHHGDTSDNVTKNVLHSLSELGQWVSAERLIQFLESLPKVAPHVNSWEEFTAYLALIETLALKAPRNLKTLLDNAPMLLDVLPLSGFKYWANFGVNAHANNAAAIDAYFSLSSTESQTVLQQQRRGTLFSDIQRQLQFFLRAVWGKEFFMRPIASCYTAISNIDRYAIEDSTNAKVNSGVISNAVATIENGVILLPDAIDSDDHSNSPSLPCRKSEKQVYRAMAAHCAAHLRYSRPRVSKEYNALERVCIELFEDARVEALAIRIFPGLKSLWLGLHRQSSPLLSIRQSPQQSSNPMLTLQCISVALLNMDIEETHPHPLVELSLRKFTALMNRDMPDGHFEGIEQLGCWLASELKVIDECERSVAPLSLRPFVVYRDDNQYLWRKTTADIIRWEIQHQRQVKRTVSVMEMVNEIDCELADENAQEIWVLESEFFRDGDPENVSMNEQEAKERTSPPFFYPEWDYGLDAHRPAWVTLTERRVPKGNAEDIDRIIAKRQILVRRIKAMVEALQPKGLIRLRKQYEGDGLDLDAAIEAMKELRRGALPDMNIDQRLKRQERDLAVLVLLDLSQSTLDAIPNDIESRTILNVAQEATVMLASALDGIGDAFAIHGFSSNGRHDVQYQRVKDFEDEYDDAAKSRLAGIKGGLSTRMGAALRHAKTFLAEQPQRKKLLLLVSDGEPADIDVRDPLYLQADTRRAVEELCSQGVIPYCLTIDPNADNYVCQVFGQGHYTVVDRVTQLPDVLPNLFASLTKRAG